MSHGFEGDFKPPGQDSWRGLPHGVDRKFRRRPGHPSKDCTLFPSGSQSGIAEPGFGSGDREESEGCPEQEAFIPKESDGSGP
jgi:hypothetical protein